MNSGFQVARLLGIPIVINPSWLLTLGFITLILALFAFPTVFAPESQYRDDKAVHWGMAVVSGLAFFGSILLHELAHSVVALKQGIPVKNITLFIFGGVSQIAGESRRPLHEFVMAVIGPFTSLLLAALFLGVWWLAGASSTHPAAIVLQWLFWMNLILAAFNMAPGFPMDGGRALRALVWGLSGNPIGATRIATLSGRTLGYGLMVLGGFAIFGVFQEYVTPIGAIWLIVLGMYLENAARQSWFQAKALDVLGKNSAENIMTRDLQTALKDERLHYLYNRGGRRFMFFIMDEDEHVVGVLTENEVEAVSEAERGQTTASQVMLQTGDVPVAMPREDAATMLQRMENSNLWHMPVVDDGRVVGVVSKEDLLRLLARGLFPQGIPGNAKG